MSTKLKHSLLALIVMSAFGLISPVVAQPGGAGGPPDFSEAAEALGISEQDLIDALGGPPPNFEAAAEKLGVSQERLMEVMPPPPEGGPPQ